MRNAIARSAEKAITRQIAEKVAERALDGVIGESDIITADYPTMMRAAEKVTHQNPLMFSKRAYAALASVLALMLSVFGLEMDASSLSEILVMGGALLSAVLAAWDKASDIRAVRKSGHLS